jgi:hypothetical protein
VLVPIAKVTLFPTPGPQAAFKQLVNKQTNKQKLMVWLRQGSKVETTRHTG